MQTILRNSTVRHLVQVTRFVAISSQYNLGRFLRNIERLVTHVRELSMADEHIMEQANNHIRRVASPTSWTYAVHNKPTAIVLRDALAEVRDIVPSTYIDWLTSIFKHIVHSEKRSGLAIHAIVSNTLIGISLAHARCDVIDEQYKQRELCRERILRQREPRRVRAASE